MGVISAIRSLALNIILFAGLELSHHLGGGNYSFSLFLVPVFAVSFFIFWFRPVEIVRGPYLALLLVFIQVLGHFELSGNTEIPTLRMSGSHVIAIALSYYLASNFDNGLLALVEILGSFFQARVLVLFKLIPSATGVLGIVGQHYHPGEYFASLWRRGPPFLAIKRT